MILEVKNLSKSYQNNNNSNLILNDISFSIQKKEIVSLYGASGSGKTTLFNILSGLIDYDHGEIIFEGNLIKSKLDFNSLRKFNLGIIFQDDYLLSEFNVIENIILPQLIIGKNKENAYQNAETLLNHFDLVHLRNKYPSFLSGGERQRISILRAVINKPKLIIADEPTGNIDENNKEKIFSLFKNIIDEYDSSIIIATHDNNVSKISNKILNLYRGKIK